MEGTCPIFMNGSRCKDKSSVLVDVHIFARILTKGYSREGEAMDLYPKNTLQFKKGLGKKYTPS